jgi:PKD repeat protein
LTGYATGGTGPYTYAWDLGDGTSSTQQNPTHVYGAGSFTASLTITDSAGKSSQATTHVTVYPALAVNSTVTPTQGASPLQVVFSASTSGGLAPYQYTWDFGDGTSGSGPSQPHSYDSGTFNATLTVHDAAGGSWTGAVASITSIGPPNFSGPPPTSPTPTPAPTASPSAEPSPTGTSAPTGPQHDSGSGGGGTNPVPLLAGALAASGAGGLLFAAWRRRRLR